MSNILDIGYGLSSKGECVGIVVLNVTSREGVECLEEES